MNDSIKLEVYDDKGLRINKLHTIGGTGIIPTSWENYIFASMYESKRISSLDFASAHLRYMHFEA